MLSVQAGGLLKQARRLRAAAPDVLCCCHELVPLVAGCGASLSHALDSSAAAAAWRGALTSAAPRAPPAAGRYPRPCCLPTAWRCTLPVDAHNTFQRHCTHGDLSTCECLQPFSERNGSPPQRSATPLPPHRPPPPGAAPVARTRRAARPQLGAAVCVAGAAALGSRWTPPHHAAAAPIGPSRSSVSFPPATRAAQYTHWVAAATAATAG